LGKDGILPVDGIRTAGRVDTAAFEHNEETSEMICEYFVEREG
jgi:hypothetical protein